MRVLVTGASGGIGKAIARTLDARGATVVLSGRRIEELESVREELRAGAVALPADLETPGGPAELAQAAGAVDVLVANAGLPASGRLLDFSPEEIDRAMMVNLRAPMQLARALAPGMIERGRGNLLFVSSLSGKIASPGSSVYSATKFGLRGFAAGLREDLHGTGVGVTTVYPGFIRDAGMFAEAGVKLPPGVGTRPPQQVAEAVARAIERGKPEVDVAPLGLRAAAVFSGVAPVTLARGQRALGSAKVAAALARGQRHKR
jgi:uncharacterized protein